MSNHNDMPNADRLIRLEELLPDLDNLNADDRMVVITLIRHTVPRLSLSTLLAHLQSSPNHVRDCVRRLIDKRAIRVLDVDDPRTLICVSRPSDSNQRKTSGARTIAVVRLHSLARHGCG